MPIEDPAEVHCSKDCGLQQAQTCDRISHPPPKCYNTPMDFKLIFGILSIVVAIVCFLPYFNDIFKRKTEPHMYSWLIWTILQGVGVAAQLKDGAGYGT